jgi:hypothetical protein
MWAPLRSPLDEPALVPRSMRPCQRRAFASRAAPALQLLCNPPTHPSPSPPPPPPAPVGKHALSHTCNPGTSSQGSQKLVSLMSMPTAAATLQRSRRSALCSALSAGTLLARPGSMYAPAAEAVASMERCSKGGSGGGRGLGAAAAGSSRLAQLSRWRGGGQAAARLRLALLKQTRRKVCPGDPNKRNGSGRRRQAAGSSGTAGDH